MRLFKTRRIIKVMELNPKTTEHTEMLFDSARDQSFIDTTCPDCGYAPIYIIGACHTYQVNNKWMSCISCYSAGHLYCDNEDCDWSYDWGLNPKNPRSISNEKNRPAWLVGDWPY